MSAGGLNPGKIARCATCGQDHYPTGLFGRAAAQQAAARCSRLKRAKQRAEMRERAIQDARRWRR